MLVWVSIHGSTPSGGATGEFTQAVKHRYIEDRVCDEADVQCCKKHDGGRDLSEFGNARDRM